LGAWLTSIVVAPLSLKLTLDIGGYHSTPGKHAVALLWLIDAGIPITLLSLGHCVWSCRWAARRAAISDAHASRAAVLSLGSSGSRDKGAILVRIRLTAWGFSCERPHRRFSRSRPRPAAPPQSITTLRGRVHRPGQEP
jgi:hypothetical protein